MNASAFNAGKSEVEEVTRLAMELLRKSEFQELISEATSIQRELPCSVPLNHLPQVPSEDGGYLEGNIDLFLKSRQRMHILGYKIDKVEAGYAEEAARRYWPQLALYGLAARECIQSMNEIELIICFVRPGRLVRHPLDRTLLEQVTPIDMEISSTDAHTLG